MAIPMGVSDDLYDKCLCCFRLAYGIAYDYLLSTFVRLYLEPSLTRFGENRTYGGNIAIERL